MIFKWITHLPLQRAVVYFFVLILVFLLIITFLF